MVKTLAIETSCDDTSVGIVHFDGEIFTVEALLAYSQIQDHQQYGGVVPEIASRLHSDKIIEVIKTIGFDKIKDVDFISVTTHPGLPGSLVVGKAVASLLAEYYSKPLIQVNHIYGHLFSLLLERKLSEIQFPMVVLTASGGHNDIYVVTNSECRIQNAE
jgi:N6-L-threonylcarbamoyladenine synthase